MFGRILCPVDFSEASSHAIRFAAALARLEGAALDAIHVSDGNVIAADVAALFDPAVLDRVTVRKGQPVAEILNEASTLRADAIVMGTHGAGGFEHLILGSVAEKILRKATCPVFTVPPAAPFAAEAQFKRLVCAVDFSEWSLAALDQACALARDSHGTVTAVHVIEWPWNEHAATPMEGIPEEQAKALAEYRRYLETMARSRLDQTVAEVADGQCSVDTKVLHGKPYAEILCTAERLRADLIVLGVHSRSALDVFFFGSTTHHVVRRAPSPVLTLRH
jgi:nucleotide-binding universal stress UspA family protein